MPCRCFWLTMRSWCVLTTCDESHYILVSFAEFAHFKFAIKYSIYLWFHWNQFDRKLTMSYCFIWLTTELFNLVTHLCISELSTLVQTVAISRSTVSSLSFENLEMIFSEIKTFEYRNLPSRKIHLNLFSAKRWPFCSGHNISTHCGLMMQYGNKDLVYHWLK